MSVVVPAPESFHRSDIDLSDPAPPIGPILESAFAEAVTEMALLTPEGSFLRANAALCRLLGRTEAELAGMTVGDVTHPDDRGSLRAVLDDARSGVLRGFRTWGRAIGAGGEAIPMPVAATMLRGETGEESAPGQGTVVEATLPVSPPGSVGIGPESMGADTSEGRR